MLLFSFKTNINMVIFKRADKVSYMETLSMFLKAQGNLYFSCVLYKWVLECNETCYWVKVSNQVLDSKLNIFLILCLNFRERFLPGQLELSLWVTELPSWLASSYLCKISITHNKNYLHSLKWIRFNSPESFITIGALWVCPQDSNWL